MEDEKNQEEKNITMIIQALAAIAVALWSWLRPAPKE